MKGILFFCIATTFLTVPSRGQSVDFRASDFQAPDSVARLYPNHSLKNLKALTDKLTTPFATEHQKFRAIYSWVCMNIQNDYPLFVKNRQMRKKLKGDTLALNSWSKKMSTLVSKRLLAEYKTVCTGYAYLIREMAAMAGIKAVIVDGYGRTINANIGEDAVMNHSWNAVRLNNAWYLCDPTWSSGDYDTQNKEFIAKYDPSYFLANPELFARNHYPQDTVWMFLKKKPSIETFLKGPVVYRGAFHYNICPLEPQGLMIDADKGTKVTFQLLATDKGLLSRIGLMVEKAFVEKEIREVVPGLYSFAYTFKNRGIFDVHVLVDSVFIYTHTVKVR